MSANPTVSIILPTYNGAGSISHAIDSVLLQGYADWELIVVDDGSVDGVADIVRLYQKSYDTIRYIKNEKNIGLRASLNKALEYSRGKYIARIDDDDEWLSSEKLEYQVLYMQQHPDVVLVGTGVVLVNGAGIELTRYYMPETDRGIRKKMLQMNCFVHSSVLFSKETALSVGGYEGINEDYGLWLKMGTKGAMANVQQYWVRYAVQPGRLNSVNKRSHMRENISFIRRYKETYPGYRKALMLNYLKLYLFWLFNILPQPVQGILLKLHKHI